MAAQAAAQEEAAPQLAAKAEALARDLQQAEQARPMAAAQPHAAPSEVASTWPPSSMIHSGHLPEKKEHCLQKQPSPPEAASVYSPDSVIHVHVQTIAVSSCSCSARCDHASAAVAAYTVLCPLHHPEVVGPVWKRANVNP